MEKVSAVYKIINTITGDFYIGSSKDVKHRWESHKRPSVWKKCPNNPLYKDIQKYGTDYFVFEILAEVEVTHLKEKEQWFIEKLKPTYNNRRANGRDVERCKKYKKEYQKEYEKSDKRKEYQKKYRKEYNNQPCYYNGETLTLRALLTRFSRDGIPNPTIEAKKYILE